MKIKATKTSTCEVEVPFKEAAEMVRHELNAHGSRSAGTNVSIPPHAQVFVHDYGTDGAGEALIFRWTESS